MRLPAEKTDTRVHTVLHRRMTAGLFRGSTPQEKQTDSSYLVFFVIAAVLEYWQTAERVSRLELARQAEWAVRQDELRTVESS